MKTLFNRIERWVFVNNRYPVLMITVFILALFGAYWSKFNIDASFHEAVTRAIKAIGL